MEIPFKRVVWNEHEAALLVDTFEKVREGVVSRDKAIVNPVSYTHLTLPTT